MSQCLHLQMGVRAALTLDNVEVFAVLNIVSGVDGRRSREFRLFKMRTSSICMHRACGEGGYLVGCHGCYGSHLNAVSQRQSGEVRGSLCVCIAAMGMLGWECRSDNIHGWRECRWGCSTHGVPLYAFLES